MEQNNQSNSESLQLSEDLAYTTFNDWLSARSDEDLAQLVQVADQMNQRGEDRSLIKKEDENTLVRMLTVAIHFTDKPEITAAEVETAFMVFATNIAMEVGVRQGSIIKEGISSMIPEENTAKFSINNSNQ